MSTDTVSAITLGAAASTGSVRVAVVRLPAGSGGAGDFGFVRRLLNEGIVPDASDIDDVGFFAEHVSTLPPADCGERLCPQAMVGTMANLVDGSSCTLLQVGINSPLTLAPEDRPPLTVAVVVDVSGSMEGAGKMEFVRQGLRRMVNELDDGDQLAIVAYSDTASVRHAMAPVDGNRNALLDVIDGLLPSGGTNIFDGLETGYIEVLGHFDGARQHRVIFLSDGVATAGNTASANILSMSDRFSQEGIPLTTVGVGTDFDLELMRTLAEQGEGNFYFLDDGAAVDEVFTEEIATFFVPVGFDVTLDVRVGDEWNIRDVYGVRSFVVDEDGRGGQVTLPAVYLAGRTDADDTFEGEGRRGGGSVLLVEVEAAVIDDTDGASDVGSVELTFTGPREEAADAGDVVVVAAATSTEFGATTTPTRGYFENTVVEKSFVMLNLLVGMRAAANAFHAGQGGEAISIIDNLAAAAADYEDSANDGAGDADIVADLELLELFRAVLLQNGAIDPNAPPSEDPWPAD
jgi:Ca-activated chloride channel family protein